MKVLKYLIFLSLAVSISCFFCVNGVFAQTDVFEQNVNEYNVSSSYTPTDESPQMWEFEFRTGFWMPHNSLFKRAYKNFPNLIFKAQGGLLWNKRYGAGVSVGLLNKSGRPDFTDASGTTSNQQLKIFTVPIEINFTWRADYFTWRYIIPYVRTGFDIVYYRHIISGNKTTGTRLGMHWAGGMMLNIAEMSGSRGDLDGDMGINDLFLTVEAGYQYIDSFGKSGFDFSGYVFSFGLLFEF